MGLVSEKYIQTVSSNGGSAGFGFFFENSKE